MAQLRVKDGHSQGKVYPLGEDVETLGRAGHVRILNAAASRQHAEVFAVNDMYFLRDVGSRNGTYLNGELLGPHEEALLCLGDEIRIGMTRFAFEASGRHQIPALTEGRLTPVGDAGHSPRDAFGFAGIDTVFLEGVSPSRLISIITKYQPIKTIARGGMGSVILVQEKLSRRFVALKIMRDGNYDKEPLVHQFVREAVITARLQHPAIIPVYDLGFLTENVLYYTMKFVDGHRFSDMMGKLELRASLQVFLSACRALHFAHSHSLWHRDVKPENILVGTDGDTYVIDWGLVSVSAGMVYHFDLPTITLDRVRYVLPDNLLAETGSAIGSTASSRGICGSPGSILGTPGYISPEQLLDMQEFLGPKSDIWALGVILYQILTGVHPIREDSSASAPAVIVRTLDCDIPDPRDRRSGIPSTLARMCLDMLRRDPRERPPSLRVVIDDLSTYLAGAESTG